MSSWVALIDDEKSSGNRINYNRSGPQAAGAFPQDRTRQWIYRDKIAGRNRDPSIINLTSDRNEDARIVRQNRD